MIETAQAKQSLADIEARYGDIIKLEKSIKELHEMFIDIAALVQTQVNLIVFLSRFTNETFSSSKGEMIDQILFNVGQSEDFIDRGRENLREGVVQQTAARRVS